MQQLTIFQLDLDSRIMKCLCEQHGSVHTIFLALMVDITGQLIVTHKLKTTITMIEHFFDKYLFILENKVKIFDT
jgi:hypothetical protein